MMVMTMMVIRESESGLSYDWSIAIHPAMSMIIVIQRTLLVREHCKMYITNVHTYVRMQLICSKSKQKNDDDMYLKC